MKPQLVLLTILFASSAAALAAGTTDSTTRARVRGASTPARELLATALRASATVRSLAEELTSSDVIVHVELAMLDTPSRATTKLVTATPHSRYLRITIDRMTSPFEMIPLLAHELQHAIEIARAPEVRDSAGMRKLYARIGMDPQEQHSFETEEARLVERRARREYAGRPR